MPTLLPSRKFSSAVSPRPLWVGYSFALSASALGMVAELYFQRFTGQQIPFLFGFAAVIASAAWAGPGPGLAAILVTLVWASIFETQPGGFGSVDLLVRSFLFTAEALLLCYGSARIWRFTREAAESESWHRQLVETAGEGIWIRDAAGTVVWANQRMADLLGLPIDKLTGRTAEDFFFPADVAVERMRQEGLRPGIRGQFDRRLRRSDGAEIWVVASCNRTASGPDDAGTVLDMMTDITERRRAEAELRRSEQRFRDLFDGVLEGVYQSLPDGRIVAANAMLLDMLGLGSQAELNAIHAAGGLYADPVRRQELLERLANGGLLQHVECEIRRPDGRIITVLENARAVRGEANEVLYYEGTLVDITDRKRMEEQLRQAQKTEAAGRLAGGVAHDFSRILTEIGEHARVAVSALTPSHPAHESCVKVVEATESAMALTRQLLSFSRQSVPEAAADANRPVINPEAPGDRGTILLVEDDPLVRELTRDMLERQGYRAILAADAGEAERVGEKLAHLDLLITDAVMRGTSGPELARRLRQTRPELRVLYVAGYAEPALRHEDTAVPGTAQIEKPFSADALERRIRQMLDKA